MSEADHRRALALVGEVAGAASVPELVGALLPGLHRAVGADEVSYVEIHGRTWQVGTSAGYPTTPQADARSARVWATRPTEHPAVRFALRPGRREAVRLSELCSRSTLQRLPYYRDFYRPRGMEHAEYAPIATADGMLAVVALNRAGRDFSDREHEVVEHLRRPLIAVWAAARRTETLRAITLREQRPPVDLAASLTPTERRVAGLVGRGWSNREVAVGLGVSSKAVEQHLTRVYRALGVRSRSQLVRLLLTDTNTDTAAGPVS